MCETHGYIHIIRGCAGHQVEARAYQEVHATLTGGWTGLFDLAMTAPLSLRVAVEDMIIPYLADKKPAALESNGVWRTPVKMELSQAGRFTSGRYGDCVIDIPDTDTVNAKRILEGQNEKSLKERCGFPLLLSKSQVRLYSSWHVGILHHPRSHP